MHRQHYLLSVRHDHSPLYYSLPRTVFLIVSFTPGCVVPPYPGLLSFNPFGVWIQQIASLWSKLHISTLAHQQITTSALLHIITIPNFHNSQFSQFPIFTFSNRRIVELSNIPISPFSYPGLLSFSPFRVWIQESSSPWSKLHISTSAHQHISTSAHFPISQFFSFL